MGAEKTLEHPHPYGTDKLYPAGAVAHHCPDRGAQDQGKDILYTPDPNQGNRAAEKELERAVASYAEDNLVVVRVRTIRPTQL